jgi:hypothetical protein
MTQEATNSSINVLHQKVTTYLEEYNIKHHCGQDGSYAVRQGSTAVFIKPIEWVIKGKVEHTLVQLMAPVALDITNTGHDLVLYLTTQNNTIMFGKFSVDIASKTVWFEHVLLGDFLDPEELIVALQMVAVTADAQDETIAKLAGGLRAIDKANEPKE